MARHGLRKWASLLRHVALAVVVAAAVAACAGPQQVAAQQQQAQQQQPKLGLAPHDRAPCQLPAPSRRHGAARPNQNEVTPSVEQNSSNLMSTPSVVSLLQAQDLQAPGSGKAQATATKASRFDSSERLRQLRQLLASNSYDAYLVTPNDEHGSEYVTEYDRRLRFISGFTGSNGYALILHNRAVLFTDGRYAIQADLDLDCSWWLVVGDEPLADIGEWLRLHAAKGLKIATDARLMTLQSYDYLEEKVRQLDCEFALISQDLIDVVWNSQQSPPRPHPRDPIFIHPLQFAGNVTWQEKSLRLARAMEDLQANHYVVSRLDDIAWLFNLRGSDIPMAPLFKAYLLVSRGSSTTTTAAPQTPSASSVEQLLAQRAGGLQSPQVLQVPFGQLIRLTLYVDLRKVDATVRDYLHLENGTLVQGKSEEQQAKIQVELKDYDVFIMDIRDKLAGLGQQAGQNNKLLIDAGANVAIHVLAKAHDNRLILVEGLIQSMKAVKSSGEVQGMRLAHWRDSLAISMLLAQLERDIGASKLTNRWTETRAADELAFYRSLMDYNRGESFDTISAYGATSAIVHYKPQASDQRFIGNSSTYLLDCGGQYLDGTTDITRTMHYGEPSEFQREAYTRVLMGAVDMMSLLFDQTARSTAYRLNDLLSRRHLFELGLDYQHGTGHGIGLFSLVHESPYLLEHYATSAEAKRQNSRSAGSPLVHSQPVALQPNMFTSVEPGYYKANDFGIRLENIVVTQRLHTPASFWCPNDRQAQGEPAKQVQGERQFLRFEPLSLVPFEPKLMKMELLSNKQKTWLNSYNLMVRLRLTQQINHYLAKIRAHHHQSQPIQVQGPASSSRIYQHLLANSSRANSSLGLNNFLRMDAGQLQEKLEQTHRWILSKTELIPLDVPQSFLQHQDKTGVAGEANQAAPEPQQQDKRQQEQARQDGQRLMLVYMSSLPFADQEAGEALSQMRARSDLASAGGQFPFGGSGGGSSNHTACTGYQCDLMLANALGGLAQPGSSSPAPRQQRNHQEAANWNQRQQQDHEFDLTTSLMDLFQLSGGQQQASSLGSLHLWCLGLLGLLAVLQLAILNYVCRSGRGQHGGALSGRRRSRRNELQATPMMPAMIASHPPQASRQGQAIVGSLEPPSGAPDDS